MTASPAAPSQPAPQATPPAPPGDKPAEDKPADWWERAGTAAMVAVLAGLAIVLVDVALKGRLLGPVFARLPVPKSQMQEEAGGEPPRAAGE